MLVCASHFHDECTTVVCPLCVDSLLEFGAIVYKDLSCKLVYDLGDTSCGSDGSVECIVCTAGLNSVPAAEQRCITGQAYDSISMLYKTK